MDPLTNSFSIVIPAYNEQSSICDVIRGLETSYPGVEIIVIDDGSTDGTREEIKKTNARLVIHRQNRGYGASLKSGVRQATGQIVLFFDGDGQFNIEDAGKMIEKMTQLGSELIIGERGKNSHTPLVRRPGKYLLKRIVNFLAKTRIKDINCGLRATRRDLILPYLHLLPDGFSASTTSTLLFLKLKRQVDFMPLEVKTRVGTSSVSQLRDGFGTILLVIRLISLFNPLRVFLPISLILVSTSVLYSLYESIVKGLGVPVLGAVLFIGGLLCFFLGIVCDQISALRLQSLPSRYLE